MTISDNFSLSDILLKLETALQIDGRDYGERDVDIIMSNIYKRIQRQYQLDLTNTKLTDDALYIGPTRQSAQLFLDNLTELFGKLAGYSILLNFKIDGTNSNTVIEIMPRNISYCSASRKGFMQFMSRCRVQSLVQTQDPVFKYIEQQFGTFAKCNEKRLILIMIVAYRLGLYELICIIANIFIIGDTI